MRTRSSLALAVAILSVVALAPMLGGCGGSATGAQASVTPSGSSAGTSTASAGLVTYKNDRYHFAVSYDGSKFKETDQPSTNTSAGAKPVFRVGFACLSDDTGADAMLVSVYKLDIKITDENMDSFRKTLEQLLAAYQKSLGEEAQVGILNTVTINGVKGYTVEMRFIEGEQRLQTQMVFLASGDTEYLVQVQATEEDWQTLAPDYADMVKSFRIIQ